MIDIESRVAETLRARADEHVDVEQLHAGTLARAGAIRRRQTWAVSGAAGLATVVAVAAVTATVVAAPAKEPAGGTGNPASVAGEPAADGGPTTLPVLTGAPSAAAQPGAVGSDPAVLHLDVDLAAMDVTASDWRSGPGYEGVTLRSGSGLVDIYVGPDSAALEAGRPAPGPVMYLDDGTTGPLYQETEPEPTTVDGSPGTLQLITFDVDEFDPEAPPGSRIAGIDLYSPELGEHTTVLRWQPVAGLHAIVQVRGGGEADAFAAASALRLDRVQRCPTPFQVTRAPAGTDWTECRVSVVHNSGGGWDWALGSVSFTGSGGDEVMVHVEDATQSEHPGDLGRIVPNRTVAGKPAWWSEESPAGLYLPKLGPVSVFVSGLAEPAATQLVEDLTVAGDLDQPESWPA